MAKQVINIGNAPNDASGDPLRTAFNKINENFTEVYTDVQTISDVAEGFDNSYRCQINQVVETGSSTIAFTSPFINANYLLEITDALGIVSSLVSQNANGFTVMASGNGTIHYKATYIK